MQQTTICTACGAGIPNEARFCRVCGQRSNNPGSVTEGTTRLLETPERPAAAGQPVEDYHGGLAQATTRLPPQVNPTSRDLETARPPQNWVLISVILVAAAAVILTILFVTQRSAPTPAPAPPVITRPEVPEVPPAEPPPLPPPPPGVPGGGGISRTLVYPGAQTVMEMSGTDEGNVLHLRTSDSVEKVADWYTEKLKPGNVLRIKEPLPGVILEAGETKVIINTEGSATSILLQQGGD